MSKKKSDNQTMKPRSKAVAVSTNNIDFFDKVAALVEQARVHVGRTADLTMCVTYFEIGRMIVEEEQGGKARAEYGSGLLKELSKRLNVRFKRGFSETNLKNARKFFLVYGQSIQQLLAAESGMVATHAVRTNKADESANASIRQLLTAEFDVPLRYWRSVFKVSWTHYLVLMRIKDADERRFYELETISQGWSVGELKREYNSSLYERLALSRDKDEVMRLAKEGQVIEKPRDILKDPLVLEFLGMAEDAAYSEDDLESAVLDKLQKFLLEMGKGFLYEARQKRFTFDEKHFKVDLVLYNRLLRCYVLIDFKITELVHQDLGQMLMYVNYFDRYVKKEWENPTVGILLCKERDENIVELTLPEDANIYATEYSLYLPDKSLLQQKLAEWVKEYEEAKEVIEAAQEEQ